jgi:translation initiation factor 2B subunit (eIF-2B alpha/beta/delta family)
MFSFLGDAISTFVRSVERPGDGENKKYEVTQAIKEVIEEIEKAMNIKLPQNLLDIVIDKGIELAVGSLQK